MFKKLKINFLLGALFLCLPQVVISSASSSEGTESNIVSIPSPGIILDKYHTLQSSGEETSWSSNNHRWTLRRNDSQSDELKNSSNIQFIYTQSTKKENETCIDSGLVKIIATGVYLVADSEETGTKYSFNLETTVNGYFKANLSEEPKFSGQGILESWGKISLSRVTASDREYCKYQMSRRLEESSSSISLQSGVIDRRVSNEVLNEQIIPNLFRSE